MHKSFKSSIIGLLCATIAAGDLPSEALAGPMSMTDPATLGPSSPAETVHYRRHWGHRHYYRHYHRHRYWGHRHHHWRYHRYRHHRRYRYGYDPAGAIFAGAALGVMAAGIAAATRPRYYGWSYPYYGYGWGYPRWGWRW
jgi:hypothetical protein